MDPTAESAAQPAMVDREAQLSHCLDLLFSATRDEDKFVGLMLLARVLDPNDQEAVRRAFDSIPWKFISRLLVTRDTSAELPVQILHSVAVNIINAFSSFDVLVTRPELTSRAGLVADLLSDRHDEAIATPILQSLLRMAVNAPTQLSEAKVPSILAKTLPHLQNESDREFALQALEMMAQPRSAAVSHSSRDDMHESAMFSALQPLSAIFASEHTALKFRILQLLIQILSSTKTIHSNRLAHDLGWEGNIRQGLKDIFGSKISQSQRELALVLSAIMIRMVGPTWMFGISPDKKGKGTERLSHAQFGTILLHIACAEIRVTLDDLPDTDYFDDTAQPAQILPACYEILERTMRFLVDGQYDESEVLASDNLLSLRGALGEAFAAVGAFLVDRMTRYQVKADFKVFDNIVTAFSIRASATYLGEVTDLPAKEVSHVIPALVAAARNRLTSIDVHPIEFLTPAFTNITADDETRQLFVDCGGFPILVNYLHSTNPSIQLATALIGILLNLIVSHSVPLERHAESLTLVQTLTEKYSFRGADKGNADSVILAANATTLALFTLRDLNKAQVEMLGPIVVLAVQDQAAAFVTARPQLEVSWTNVWEDVSELWFLTVNGWLLVEAFFKAYVLIKKIFTHTQFGPITANNGPTE
ncbi:hypothetical protein HDV00_004324 [Rhizophlyctis rosea]|nr:hypothetical protein HDV00_004324 [Rhizophlyctis rosea]